MVLKKERKGSVIVARKNERIAKSCYTTTIKDEVASDE